MGNSYMFYDIFNILVIAGIGGLAINLIKFKRQVVDAIVQVNINQVRPILTNLNLSDLNSYKGELFPELTDSKLEAKIKAAILKEVNIHISERKSNL